MWLSRAIAAPRKTLSGSASDDLKPGGIWATWGVEPEDVRHDTGRKRMRTAVNGDYGFAVRAESESIGMGRHFHLFAERGDEPPVREDCRTSGVNLHG